MPTYEYECIKCKHRFEIFQNMSDEPISSGSVCEGKVKRLIGAGAGIIFKGSGFYVNDYKKSSSTTNGRGNGETSKSNDSSSDKGSSDTSAGSSSSTSAGSGD